GASDADRHARNAPGVKRALKSISPGNQVERFVVGKIEHFAVNRFGRGPQQLEILIGEVFNIAEGFQSGRASDVKVETAFYQLQEAPIVAAHAGPPHGGG